jgi:hypothetical protein
MLTFNCFAIGIYLLGCLCEYLALDTKPEIGFLIFSTYFKSLAFALIANSLMQITHYTWGSFLIAFIYFAYQSYGDYRLRQVKIHHNEPGQ